MPKEAVNLKQLADHLGLSPTTVSRALNGYPEVRETTRQRVLQAADKLNYRPSHFATRLAAGKANTIGHVVSLADHLMANPHFSDVMAGAGEACAHSGYDMLLSVVDDSVAETDAYRSLAQSKRVDGVIVHGPSVDDRRIAMLNALRLPFVAHGRSRDPQDSYCWLDVNNRRAFRRATEFLLDLGHRHIALVNGPEAMNFAARRRMGYLEALRSRRIDGDPTMMFSGDMIEPLGYSAMKRLLALRPRPTAAVSSSILPALGALRALQEEGLEVGRDMSIVAHDDQLSFLQMSGEIPLFTSTRSSVREAGKRVAEMIIERIHQPASAPFNELWEAELVLGNSTGPPRHAEAI